MAFRASFECLWCGRSWSTRGLDDIEGFAQLCPDCVGRADQNEFLRFRLRAALEERARAMPAPAGDQGAALRPPDDQGRRDGRPGDLAAEMVAYYEARAGEYDDWYLRRGRYSHGPVHDAAWLAELDQATRWLDDLPIAGEIVELAAGTGWWSPLLAAKGELSAYDLAGAPLDRARARLLAHGSPAHIHRRDAWERPDRAVDALFCGFWLSHVARDRLGSFLVLALSWLKPGGLFAFIDSRADPRSGAVDQPPPDVVDAAAGIVRRRLADGREFRIPKVVREPTELEAALLTAGFEAVRVSATARFFVLGSARAPAA